MTFELDKKNTLNKLDKSRIGQIDKEIRKICDAINSFEEYYTTSSCSGRIVLLETPCDKKNEAKWIFMSHSETDFDSISKNLKSNTDVWLRQEGAILHVCCKTLKSAEKIVNLARNSGFKRAGMISVNDRFVVEIISSEHLCAPVVKEGKKLITDDYLVILVKESNKKMTQNRKKLKKFEQSLRNL